VLKYASFVDHLSKTFFKNGLDVRREGIFLQQSPTGLFSRFFSVLPAAAADGAEGAQRSGDLTQFLIMIGALLFIFYFLMFRPQKKKQQQHDKMLASISRGDSVVSAGGFFGKVCDVLDDSFIIEISDGVRVRILKSSITVRRETSDSKQKSGRPKKKRRRIDGGETARTSDGELTVSENKALVGRRVAEESTPESAETSEGLPVEPVAGSHTEAASESAVAEDTEKNSGGAAS
jgi:preprotein translocase subunit YajC